MEETDRRPTYIKEHRNYIVVRNKNSINSILDKDFAWSGQ